ncbi:polysaccharide biosynthesis protein [Psychrosphaera aestuarii]|uniref:hypothetical protein n=1 Tax=Psychrosphaera aestuarii TaxID=1266052 RepID=UPI001B31E514|nr:hypothetical protein [Psychrosphaera aestuarii]
MIKRIKSLGASGILVALAQVFLIVVIAQFRGLQEIGEYSYILAICVPLNVLGLFGFKQLLASEVNVASAFDNVLKMRFIFHSALFLTFLVVATYLITKFSVNVSIPLLVALCLFKFIESHHELELGKYQNQNLTHAIDKLNAFKFSVYVLISLLVMLSDLELSLLFAFGSLILFIHYFSVLRPLQLCNSETQHKVLGRYVFKRSSHLVFIALFTAVLANLPKYYLMTFSTIEQLAFFTIFFQAMSFVNMLVINLVNYQWGKIKISVAQNLTPTISHLGNADIKKLVLLISAVSLAVICFSFVSIQLVSFVFNINAQSYFFEWLIINVAFALNFYSHLLNALNIMLKREKILARTTILILGIGLLACLFLPNGQAFFSASLLLLIIFALKGVFGAYILLLGGRSDK